MIKVAVFGVHYKNNQLEHYKKLLSSLTKNNCKIAIYIHLAVEISDILQSEHTLFSTSEEISDVSFIISCGGDGTFLQAASLINNSSIPVIGMNFGRLGFLTCFTTENIDTIINNLISGKYLIEKRNRIALEVNNNPFSPNTGLNEVAIFKKNSLSFLTIHIFINNELVSSLWADGVVIATPTGSTAYSLSLGGPILLPDSKNFVITPIAPHTLTVRPIIVPDDCIIEIAVESRDGEFNVSIDSACNTFHDNTRLKIKKATSQLKMIKLTNCNFYHKLRKKLMWGSDIRN